jgi:ketosteroid isomerase-like protein
MGIAIDLIRDVWYPAWDSGDPERFERVCREIFHPEATLRPPGVHVTEGTFEEVLPRWLVELERWKPQVHEITHVVDGGDHCAWEYMWHATHAQGFTFGGKEIPATGRVFWNNAVALCYTRDGKIVHLRGASNFHDIIRELEGHELTPIFS